MRDSQTSRQSHTSQKPQSGRPPQASRARQGSRGLAVLSGLLLVLVTAAFVAASAVPMGRAVTGFLADSSSTASSMRKVSATSRQIFCPRSIGLSDSGSYGDADFAASAGDLDSARTLLAFGSTYSGQISGVGTSAAAGQALALPSGSMAGVTRSKASSPVIASSQQLSAAAGDGLVGASASWASTGDVRGIAAASCRAATSDATFLLPSMKVGRSAGLVVANDSDKSTLVSLRIWGSSKSGQIHPAANSQISIAAGSARTISLGALVGHQNAAAVSVHSSAVAVHLLVETTAAAGLTPKGVDYAEPLAASTRGTLVGLEPGDSARLLLFSRDSARVTGSWLTSDGSADTKNLVQGVSLPGGRVVSVDLGTVPEKTSALRFSADKPVWAEVVQTASASGGQEDYSLVAAHPGSRISVLPVPQGLDGEVSLANSSSASLSVRLRGIDAHGSFGSKEKTVTVPAHSSRTVSFSDLIDPSDSAIHADAHGAAVQSSPSGRSSSIALAANLTSSRLSGAKVAQSTVLPFQSLMPSVSTVQAVRSPLAAVGAQD